MSRAFIKEDAAVEDVLVAARPPLPPGVENLVTPAGLAELEAELAALRAERDRLAAGDPADTAVVRRLAALDEEIPALEDRVHSAVLVPTPPAGTDEVRVGATVTVRYVGGRQDGQSSSFTIVGVDQADPLEGLVAFTAPIAQALLGRRVGERAGFAAADGQQALELTAVSYA
ncbi:MAG: transcription elongation factor GreAB [Deinococcales bacterium]|nr:transcription elongation factor GreAB [Deinococcales bacterium]